LPNFNRTGSGQRVPFREAQGSAGELGQRCVGDLELADQPGNSFREFRARRVAP
jgi:hypothetical protein